VERVVAEPFQAGLRHHQDIAFATQRDGAELQRMASARDAPVQRIVLGEWQGDVREREHVGGVVDAERLHCERIGIRAARARQRGGIVQ